MNRVAHERYSLTYYQRSLAQAVAASSARDARLRQQIVAHILDDHWRALRRGARLAVHGSDARKRIMINFSVIGINHGHIYGQVKALLAAGARLASFYAPEPELAAPFAQAFPQATRARSEDEIL